MRHCLAITIILAAATAPAVQATEAEAKACRAGLSPLAARIYDAASPDLGPGTVIRDLLRAKVRPMVASGEVPLDQARPAARAAGACLKLYARTP